jgi:hypothetical protein
MCANKHTQVAGVARKIHSPNSTEPASNNRSESVERVALSYKTPQGRGFERRSKDSIYKNTN